MYRALNPDKTNTALKQEDAERKTVAKRTSGTKGSTSNTDSNKPRVHSGMK
jgi:hypothetical protein